MTLYPWWEGCDIQEPMWAVKINYIFLESIDSITQVCPSDHKHLYIWHLRPFSLSFMEEIL
jgi:hypothetical protein